MHKRESYPEKKVNYFKQMNKALDTYQKILIVKCDNVRSMQMHNVRIALRGKAEIIMGKNTLQKKVFTARLAADESARNKALYSAFVASDLLKENVGLVLTNDDLEGVMKVLESHKVQAAARTGAIAPVEVTIPAGITGLEPTQTSFFQALNIPTKISKGAVEILKDMVILKPGDKVGNSEAALLAKLKIEPFFYGLQVTHIYEKGAVMTLAMRSITDEQLAEATQRGVDNIAALSLALGYPTEVFCLSLSVSCNCPLWLTSTPFSLSLSLSLSQNFPPALRFLSTFLRLWVVQEMQSPPTHPHTQTKRERQRSFCPFLFISQLLWFEKFFPLSFSFVFFCECACLSFLSPA